MAASDSALVWIAFVCYLEWGLIHILAGAMTISGALKYDLASVLSAICAVAPEPVHEHAKSVEKWNLMNVRIVMQHGLNLLFVGLQCTALAFAVAFDFERSGRYAWYLALWPWLADVAYFYAIDLVEYGPLFAEAQTYIISTALILTSFAMKDEFGDDVSAAEQVIATAVPSMLIASGIVNKLLFLTKVKTPLGQVEEAVKTVEAEHQLAADEKAEDQE